jgi:hypothetical protein
MAERQNREVARWQTAEGLVIDVDSNPHAELAFAGCREKGSPVQCSRVTSRKKAGNRDDERAAREDDNDDA